MCLLRLWKCIDQMNVVGIYTCALCSILKHTLQMYVYCSRICMYTLVDVCKQYHLYMYYYHYAVYIHQITCIYVCLTYDKGSFNIKDTVMLVFNWIPRARQQRSHDPDRVHPKTEVQDWAELLTTRPQIQHTATRATQCSVFMESLTTMCSNFLMEFSSANS